MVAPVVIVERNNPVPRAPPTAMKISLLEATTVDTRSGAPLPKASKVTPYIYRNNE